jgi:mono/diheme cytochrome c family protein
MKFFLGVIATLVVEVVIGLIILYSGTTNVAASKPDTGLKAWILSETMDNSVRHHAKGIQPPALTDAAMIDNGFSRYDRMCSGCHGAPGREPGGRGFDPRPPSLIAVAPEWKPEELFWIIKHGIKMSAMPAFGGDRLKDEEIWPIVAFLQQLPSMTPEKYSATRDSLRAAMSSETERHN